MLGGNRGEDGGGGGVGLLFEGYGTCHLTSDNLKFG